MVVWLFYVAGGILHILLKASASVGSPNSPVVSYGAYFQKNGVVVLTRSFGATCLFIIWSAGSASILGDSIVPTVTISNLLVKAAVAGMFGLGIDSILDKVFARFPMLDGVLPPAPNGTPKP